MNVRWLLFCVCRFPGFSTSYSLLAVIALSLASANVNGQQADCGMKLKAEHRILAYQIYQGKCIGGFIEGNADVLYQNQGDSHRLRRFGWFKDGAPSGAHIVLLSQGTAPPLISLSIASLSGKRWVYVLDAWPLRSTSGRIPGFWKAYLVDETTEVPRLRDANGRLLISDVSSEQLFAALDDPNNARFFSLSARGSNMHDFLQGISPADPFSSSNGILPQIAALDAPAARTSPTLTAAQQLLNRAADLIGATTPAPTVARPAEANRNSNAGAASTSRGYGTASAQGSTTATAPQSLRPHGPVNASNCIVVSNSQMLNTCNFSVEVSFCVDNPKQTKSFFDSSDAFKCPNGGFTTVPAGKKEPNVLHGDVRWFACSSVDMATMHTKLTQFPGGHGYQGQCWY